MAFLYGKDHVKSAICWSVGCGATARFWWDNWGVEDKPLILDVSSMAPVEIIINKVLDFVTRGKLEVELLWSFISK